MIAGIVVSHGAAFSVDCLWHRERYSAFHLGLLMLRPYVRIIVLGAALLAGVLMAKFNVRVVGALVALLAFKTLLKLWAHRRERRRFARQG